MIKNIDYLANLYNKIASKTASDQEIFLYKIEIETSCIAKDILIDAIKSRAKELREKKVYNL